MTNETGRSQSGLYGTGGIVTGPRVGFWLYLVTDGAPDPRAALVSPLESRLSTALAAVPQGTVAVQLRAGASVAAMQLPLAARPLQKPDLAAALRAEVAVQP